MDNPKPGKIGWLDLTVTNAGEIRDFYAAVCGWKAVDHDMGAYADYVMEAPDGSRVAGICHAKGPNAGLPPVWLPYVVVEALDSAIDTALAQGGTLLERRGPNGAAGLAILKDPQGAAFALWQA